MEQIIKTYQEIRKQLMAYSYAMYVINWDSATEAPKGCFEDRAKQVGVLSEMSYKLKTSQEFIQAVETLYRHLDELDSLLRQEIKIVKRELDATLKTPMDEFIAFETLMATSQEIWANAKAKNDFSLFAPTLKKIVEFMRKHAGYLETDTLKGYNVLLDKYEPEYTTKEYDAFFDLLKKELVPFFKKVVAKGNETFDFNNQLYPAAIQKEFCDYLIDVLAFDRTYGVMKESVHPFTSGGGSTDVRFTVHYYEKDFTSSIFSAIHELGHAIYEQQIDHDLIDTLLGTGTSMGIHESQSRMFENIIGRSVEFWNVHYGKLQSLFPTQLQNVSVDEFVRFINRVEASYIRTEADELSYPLHIMLRYDLERLLIEGKIEVEDLEAEWNKRFYEYMGLEVKNASEGILQDVHWSGGMFGYFPTYALGSAYAAQIYHTMNQELDIPNLIQTKDIKQINAWLKDKIHRFGASKFPKEIIKESTHEDFNPKYYVDYLINKYSKIYKL